MDGKAQLVAVYVDGKAQPADGKAQLEARQASVEEHMSWGFSSRSDLGCMYRDIMYASG
jgi:hypothetical protein